MKTVEIQWMEVVIGDKLSDSNSYLREIKDVNTPSSVEEGFSSWREEQVEGRRIIVSNLEIFVDGQILHDCA